MEQNQSHLFVLRGDTLKRVAFLAIFLGCCLDVGARGSRPTFSGFFDATLLRCHFGEAFWGYLLWPIEFTVGMFEKVDAVNPDDGRMDVL